MNPEQVAALLMLLADLRVQCGNLAAENAELREQLAESGQNPAPPLA